MMPRARRASLCATEFLHELFELIERTIDEHELATAFAARLDLYCRAQAVGPLLFESRDITVGARLA